MKWVTREFVHVDRTACPWLIKKFLDSQAEFIFVPVEKIEEVAKIVHAADTRDIAAAPEGVGLNAIMTGARFNVKNDFEALEKAEYVYDALYSYCKLKLLREKYKGELAKMSHKQQNEFLTRKLREETISQH